MTVLYGSSLDMTSMSIPEVVEAYGTQKGMMMLQEESSGVMLVYWESFWDCDNRDDMAQNDTTRGHC